MQKQIMRFHWLIFSLVLVSLTTGCFQQVGRSRLNPTEVAQGQQVVTFTPVPSATPMPTEDTQAQAQEVTEEPATEVVQVPTEEDQFLRGTEISALALLTQQVPTETPTPSLTPTITPSVTPSVTPTFQPTEVAMLQATIDPIALTVTAILAAQQGGQQPQQVQPTAQQVQPVQEQPVQQQPQVEDPIALTATFIVQRATMTAAAPLTMTAAASGIGLPTMTPTLGAPVAGTPTTAAPAVPGADCIHEVRAEDRNLYQISLHYFNEIKVEEIARASGIANINLIVVGQKLTIPGCGTTGYTPPPTSIPPNAGADQGGGGAGSAQAAGRIHVVRQGETLFEISLQYGVTVHDIAAANGISNINVIYIGQELVIP